MTREDSFKHLNFVICNFIFSPVRLDKGTNLTEGALPG